MNRTSPTPESVQSLALEQEVHTIIVDEDNEDNRQVKARYCTKAISTEGKTVKEQSGNTSEVPTKKQSTDT